MALSWVFRSVWLVLLCLALFTSAQAHESRPAYLKITETAPGQYTVLWRTPVIRELTDSLVEHRWIDAGPEGLAGKRIEIKGLQFTITDVLARVQLHDGRSWTTISRAGEPWVEVTAALSSWQVATEYVIQGIRHILFGPDHLLFVFGLLLIVRNGWSLVKTITAFTLAHSITLAAATLGYVTVPVPPVEAMIALSILFLGPEIVRQWRGETSFTLRNPWVVAFAFGLLHGLGFASVLNRTGLPPADLLLALLFFNVGVEIGQLAFVLLIVLLERAISSLRIRWPLWAKLAPGYAVGIVGAFWAFQRALLLV